MNRVEIHGTFWSTFWSFRSNWSNLIPESTWHTSMAKACLSWYMNMNKCSKNYLFPQTVLLNVTFLAVKVLFLVFKKCGYFIKLQCNIKVNSGMSFQYTLFVRQEVLNQDRWRDPIITIYIFQVTYDWYIAYNKYYHS